MLAVKRLTLLKISTEKNPLLLRKKLLQQFLAKKAALKDHILLSKKKT